MKPILYSILLVIPNHLLDFTIYQLCHLLWKSLSQLLYLSLWKYIHLVKLRLLLLKINTRMTLSQNTKLKTNKSTILWRIVEVKSCHSDFFQAGFIISQSILSFILNHFQIQKYKLHTESPSSLRVWFFKVVFYKGLWFFFELINVLLCDWNIWFYEDLKYRLKVLLNELLVLWNTWTITQIPHNCEN